MMGKIKEFMTAMPYTVTPDFPLTESLELMERYKIRHLPVEKVGSLLGVLLYSNVRLALSVQSTRRLLVSDAMSRHCYVVSPDAAVADVVTEMVKSKSDYAVILRSQKIIGIFTATDALRILVEILTHEPARAA